MFWQARCLPTCLRQKKKKKKKQPVLICEELRSCRCQKPRTALSFSLSFSSSCVFIHEHTETWWRSRSRASTRGKICIYAPRTNIYHSYWINEWMAPTRHLYLAVAGCWCVCALWVTPKMINLASWDVVTGTGVPQLERFLRISDEKYINAI